MRTSPKDFFRDFAERYRQPSSATGDQRTRTTHSLVGGLSQKDVVCVEPYRFEVENRESDRHTRQRLLRRCRFTLIEGFGELLKQRQHSGERRGSESQRHPRQQHTQVGDWVDAKVALGPDAAPPGHLGLARQPVADPGPLLRREWLRRRKGARRWLRRPGRCWGPRRRCWSGLWGPWRAASFRSRSRHGAPSGGRRGPRQTGPFQPHPARRRRDRKSVV